MKASSGWRGEGYRETLFSAQGPFAEYVHRTGVFQSLPRAAVSRGGREGSLGSPCFASPWDWDGTSYKWSGLTFWSWGEGCSCQRTLWFRTAPLCAAWDVQRHKHLCSWELGKAAGVGEEPRITEIPGKGFRMWWSELGHQGEGFSVLLSCSPADGCWGCSVLLEEGRGESLLPTSVNDWCWPLNSEGSGVNAEPTPCLGHSPWQE